MAENDLAHLRRNDAVIASLKHSFEVTDPEGGDRLTVDAKITESGVQVMLNYPQFVWRSPKEWKDFLELCINAINEVESKL